MTTLQMKAIVLAAELKSISAAAKQLNISQSNVSAYIRDVESELGVQLLIRNRKGIIPTEQGNEFIEHAKKIFEEQNSILNINKLKQFYRLRVGSMQFSLAEGIFCQLCIENSDISNMDMLYTNTSITKGIEMLKQHQLDIVVGFIRNDLIKKAEWMMEGANIEKESLGIMKPFIRLRKDHPLTKMGINPDGTINVPMLKDYTYVDYDSFKEDDDNFFNNFANSGIHRVYVDNKESRYKILSQSDAYSMGIKLDKKTEETYGLTCIPIKDLTAEFCILTRANELESPIIQEFTNRLSAKWDAIFK